MVLLYFVDIEEILFIVDCGLVFVVVYCYIVFVGFVVGFRVYLVCVYDVFVWGFLFIFFFFGYVIIFCLLRFLCIWNKYVGVIFNIIICFLKDLYLRFEFNFNREREIER